MINPLFEALVHEGYRQMDWFGEPVPDGCFILEKGDSIVAVVQTMRSAILSTPEEALKWIDYQRLAYSGCKPGVGELWNYAERTAIICGNSISDKDNTIWVLDWNSGDCAYAPVSQLEMREDRMSLTEAAFVERFMIWAREGNADAMWWLGWWYEGINHPKSIWYYVAAVRADPGKHNWAIGRLCSDARSDCMCNEVPAPDLSFLKFIPEMQGEPIRPDWLQAVVEAEKAVHIADKKQIVRTRYRTPADALCNG